MRKLQYVNLKIIHTVKGDTFYFRYDIYKLLTCRSDGIAWFLIVMMYIQRLFLTIYDCSDPVGNLQPKNGVYRKLISFVKRSYIVKIVVRPSLRFTTFCEMGAWHLLISFSYKAIVQHLEQVVFFNLRFNS